MVKTKKADVFYMICPKCKKEIISLYKGQIEYLMEQHILTHKSV